MEIRATKPEADYPKPFGARSLRQFYQTNPLCRMDSLTIPIPTPPSPLGRERERYVASPIPGRRWRFALGYYRSSFQDCREWASKLSGFYQTNPSAWRASSKFRPSPPPLSHPTGEG